MQVNLPCNERPKVIFQLVHPFLNLGTQLLWIACDIQLILVTLVQLCKLSFEMAGQDLAELVVHFLLNLRLGKAPDEPRQA
jgi:hypothetical protein